MLNYKTIALCLSIAVLTPFSVYSDEKGDISIDQILANVNSKIDSFEAAEFERIAIENIVEGSTNDDDEKYVIMVDKKGNISYLKLKLKIEKKSIGFKTSAIAETTNDVGEDAARVNVQKLEVWSKVRPSYEEVMRVSNNGGYVTAVTSAGGMFETYVYPAEVCGIARATLMDGSVYRLKKWCRLVAADS